MSVEMLASALIPAAPEAVYTFVTRAANDTRWTSGLVSSRVLSGEGYGPGAQIERVSRFLGRTFTYTVAVLAVEPNRRVEMSTTAGPFPMQVTYCLEPAEGGTRMSIRSAGDPGGFFALAGPLLAVAARRSMQQDLDTLRELFAAGAAQG